MSESPSIPNDLADIFEGGVSILVGTRDAGLLPEATRGVGAVVHPDRRRLTVFLPVSSAGRALANIADNRQITVGFSSVLDHKTLQVKGAVEDVRPATEAEREIVSRYHSAFTELLFMTGIPRATTRTLNTWPSVAVTFTTTGIFQQTPGPNAGERMKT